MYIFALTDKNKEMLQNYKKLWDEIKKEITTIKGGIEPFKFEKDVMKIKFESNNKLPLNKIMNIPMSVIIAKSVFEEKMVSFIHQSPYTVAVLNMIMMKILMLVVKKL